MNTRERMLSGLSLVDERMTVDHRRLRRDCPEYVRLTCLFLAADGPPEASLAAASAALARSGPRSCG